MKQGDQVRFVGRGEEKLGRVLSLARPFHHNPQALLKVSVEGEKGTWVMTAEHAEVVQ